MIRFLNPTGLWINLKKKVPIYVAASGRKTLVWPEEIGDGVILFGALGRAVPASHQSLIHTAIVTAISGQPRPCCSRIVAA
jgi:hypothetical protein